MSEQALGADGDDAAQEQAVFFIIRSKNAPECVMSPNILRRATMAYATLVERTIPVSRSKVFAAFADFGGLNRFLPDVIQSIRLEGVTSRPRREGS